MVGKEGFYRLKKMKTLKYLEVFLQMTHTKKSVISFFHRQVLLVRLSFRVGSIDMSDIRDSELLM